MVECIGDTYYTDSLDINLLSLWPKDPTEFVWKRRFIKQPYKRTIIRRYHKSYSFNLDSVCRKLPNINDKGVLENA